MVCKLNEKILIKNSRKHNLIPYFKMPCKLLLHIRNMELTLYIQTHDDFTAQKWDRGQSLSNHFKKNSEIGFQKIPYFLILDNGCATVIYKFNAIFNTISMIILQRKKC